MSKKKKALIISAIILLLAFPIVAAAISYFSMIRENSRMKGDIDSLNASVALGVLAYEIRRQRLR